MKSGRRAHCVHIDQTWHEAVAPEIDSFARRVLASCIFSREHLYNLSVCDCDAVVLQKVLCVGETAADPREQKEVTHALLVCVSAISVHLY